MLIEEDLPRDDPRPKPRGLGMPPLLGWLFGLLLLPGNRLCVGDIGDFTGSAVLGRAERFKGCVPSSCKHEKWCLEHTPFKKKISRQLISLTPPKIQAEHSSPGSVPCWSSSVSQGWVLFELIKSWCDSLRCTFFLLIYVSPKSFQWCWREFHQLHVVC